MSQPLLGNRYRLGERVGLGGAAEIYEATDVHLGRPVAVKILKTGECGPEFARRFAEEARLLAAVGHPNLVPLWDAGRDGAWRYLVMPLIHGEDLARVIGRGPLPPPEVARVGAALADALAHIHAQGIVHRDLKPANVLVEPDGGIYLADFGIAHAWNASIHTADGLVVGTAGYMAPEQARGVGPMPASDVFSLGLVLLEALTAQAEYPGPALERIASVVNRSPRIPAGLTPRWRALLAAMLRREPTRRPTAAQVRDLIALECEPAAASAPPHPRHRRPEPLPSEPVSTPEVVSPSAATRTFTPDPAGHREGSPGSDEAAETQRCGRSDLSDRERPRRRHRRAHPRPSGSPGALRRAGQDAGQRRSEAA
ncbi:serine/threonine-protein kinase [Catenulispora acidiphila]|uniref:serine/threonine-protein kinase n=1 Tax=Catenulispora acidiphila TaxID=304895 RepID=UPI00019DE7D8|nr:serine/threonine-protein kinase [Catenulispora acidiphila]